MRVVQILHVDNDVVVVVVVGSERLHVSVILVFVPFALFALFLLNLRFKYDLFFVVLAALNEIVWRTQSVDVWTSFKVFGIAPLTIVFMLLQGRLVERYTRSKS